MKSLEVFSLHKQTTQMKSDLHICDCKYLYNNTALAAWKKYSGPAWKKVMSDSRG